MNLKARILNNVRDQNVISKRLNSLQEEANNLHAKHQKLIGQMEILAEIYKEQTGNDLTDEIEKSPEWKAELQKARDDGERIALGAPPKPADNQPSSEGLKKHEGNKKLQPRLVKADEQQEEKKEVVSRTRPPVKVVVTDRTGEDPVDDLDDDEDD